MSLSTLQLFSNEQNLTLNEEKRLVYGKYQDYEIAIKFLPEGLYYLNIPFNLSSKEINNNLETLFKTLKSNINTIEVLKYEDGSINLLLHSINSDDDLNNFKSILKDIINFLKENSLVSACTSCGSLENLSLSLINNNPVYLCNNCSLEFNKHIENEKDNPFNAKKFILGIIGALLFTIPGVALWVIIYNAGYIASIVGFVISFLAIKGYRTLGGKLNTAAAISTVIITFIMIYVSQHISLGFEIYDTFKDLDITIIDAILEVPTFLAYDDIKSSFIKNLLIGYGFTILASFSTFKRAHAADNQNITIEKMF